MPRLKAWSGWGQTNTAGSSWLCSWGGLEDGNAICGIMGCQQCLAVALPAVSHVGGAEGCSVLPQLPDQPFTQPFGLPGKLLSKRFPFPLLFYMFEGLHELATTLFQVLVFHIFLLESDYNGTRLLPLKWELSSKTSDSSCCYATLHMIVLLCGCFQCTYCSSCPKRLCFYLGVSFIV